MVNHLQSNLQPFIPSYPFCSTSVDYGNLSPKKSQSPLQFGAWLKERHRISSGDFLESSAIGNRPNPGAGENSTACIHIYIYSTWIYKYSFVFICIYLYLRSQKFGLSSMTNHSQLTTAKVDWRSNCLIHRFLSNVRIIVPLRSTRVVGCYWVLGGWDYQQFTKFGSCAYTNPEQQRKYHLYHPGPSWKHFLFWGGCYTLMRITTND